MGGNSTFAHSSKRGDTCKEHGKGTIAIGVKKNLSKSLINSVDKFVELSVL